MEFYILLMKLVPLGLWEGQYWVVQKRWCVQLVSRCRLRHLADAISPNMCQDGGKQWSLGFTCSRVWGFGLKIIKARELVAYGVTWPIFVLKNYPPDPSRQAHHHRKQKGRSIGVAISTRINVRHLKRKRKATTYHMRFIWFIGIIEW